MKTNRLSALLATFAFLMLSLSTQSSAQDLTKKSHGEYFEHFEGTKTCLQCHEKDAENFFHSQHYQWKGETPAIVNSGGKKLGKLNTFNDFCDIAHWLIHTRKLTSAEKMSCEGRSAGGLLIGGSINQAPHLFRVAVFGVPFVDVVPTMTDASIVSIPRRRHCRQTPCRSPHRFRFRPRGQGRLQPPSPHEERP